MGALKKELKEELLNILDYWSVQTPDEVNGGFIGAIDAYSRKSPNATKGSVLNARILWSFSAACNVLQNEDFAESAHKAFDYLSNHFFDEENGGVYWELDFQGKPINTKKQVYAQAFAIYALSEYYRFSGKDKARDLAIDLFRLLEKHSFDQEDNGYFEAYDREWNLLEDLRLSDKDANEKKSMNTHLHVLEGYANLLHVWPDERLRSQLTNLIRIHIDKILDKSTYHLNLFFDEKWNLKSSEYSFGHDIEAAWLLCDAALAVGDEKLIKEVNEVALKVSEVTFNEGLDVDGALLNEGDHGKYTDTDKHWWPQAEAIVGFINAYELSNDKKYLTAAENVWSFTNKTIIDHQNGEWWFRVNRKGVPYMDEEKAGFWKCPYHNSRACMEVIKRL